MLKSSKLVSLVFSSLIGMAVMTNSAVADGLPDFTTLVEQHRSAVVNISTKTTSKISKKSPHDFMGD